MPVFVLVMLSPALFIYFNFDLSLCFLGVRTQGCVGCQTSTAVGRRVIWQVVETYSGVRSKNALMMSMLQHTATRNQVLTERDEHAIPLPPGN